MWAAVELAIQRQELFDEDRAGANALCRGKGRKKKDAGEARYIPILIKKNRFRPNIVDIPASKKKHKGIIICCISHVFIWHIKITPSEIQMLLSSLDIHPPSIEYE